MTLNIDELARTSAELHAGLTSAGLTAEQACADLGWTAARLHDTLNPGGGADPVDVWELRDYLVHAIEDGGGTPVTFSKLTAGNKIRARMWFSLRKAPRHDFAAV